MVAKKTENTAVANWDEELARRAKVATEVQRDSGSGGKFLSTKGGVLTFDDNPLPGNQMAVVIVADIMENSFYAGAYDPTTPAAPICFAFGHKEADMEPHEKVDEDSYFDRQSPVCATCPQNEWGSAETGRGKACKNVMRLAIIPAGVYKPKGKGRNVELELEMFEDADHYRKAEVAYIKLPVMSVKNYANYVKQLAANLNRPPFSVYTLMYLEPDPKSQYKVMFELLDVVPNELLPEVIGRHDEQDPIMNFPYSPPRDEDGEGKPNNMAAQRSTNKLKGATTKKPAAKPAARGKR